MTQNAWSITDPAGHILTRRLTLGNKHAGVCGKQNATMMENLSIVSWTYDYLVLLNMIRAIFNLLQENYMSERCNHYVRS